MIKYYPFIQLIYHQVLIKSLFTDESRWTLSTEETADSSVYPQADPRGELLRTIMLRPEEDGHCGFGGHPNEAIGAVRQVPLP